MALCGDNLCAVVLAAGEGKRMRSSKPKVMLEVLLKPMLGWVLDATREAGIDDICVVTGHLEEQIKAYLGDSTATVSQYERLGTGHAVMMARPFLEQHKGGRVLIACGDAPFLSREVISAALEQHIARGDAVTVISATPDDPTGYGRIIRSADCAVKAIVEQKEGTPEQLEVREINSGAYWFDIDSLLEVLDPEHLAASGITGEHYLTDAVAAIISIGRGAGAYTAPSPDVVLGANNPVQLHDLGEIARKRVLGTLIASGVSIPCTDGVLIGPDVIIGSDTVILPGSVITGRTVIGKGCTIGPSAVLDGCTVGDGACVNASQIKGGAVAENECVGPFVSR
ncbi:MAG: NTP transferase domain-containing protein [Clostridia bacterium]|nr:NTP transferase domain-containing protein [Clostridia bacterium]